jgi:hypothetical protein
MKSNSAIWIDTPVITPERKIWRAVLGQAYADAQLPLFADGAEPLERACARAFLRADDPLLEAILKLICECAAVPCDRIVLWARKQYPDSGVNTNQP